MADAQAIRHMFDKLTIKQNDRLYEMLAAGRDQACKVADKLRINGASMSERMAYSGIVEEAFIMIDDLNDSYALLRPKANR